MAVLSTVYDTVSNVVLVSCLWIYTYFCCYSEVQASVPGASTKLAEWLSEWVIEYAIFLHC